MKRQKTLIMSMIVVLASSGILTATQMSDRIESSARKSYVFKVYLKGDDIKIQTATDSVVTLTGTVSEWSHRMLAQEIVAGFTGVKNVHNKLEIKGVQPAENSDGWIGMKVKTAFLFHRNVSGLKTEIDVKEGVVTLRGQASSQAQKELATEYAGDIDSVKSVRNEMTVEKQGKTTIETVSEYIDDASITAQVKLALLFHRSTSAAQTKVETKDGKVTVGGTAKNAAEKALVGKLVNDIKGVKGLKNEMTIG